MYRTTEIAQLVNVHPNTVRIYEEWGYLSPVPREKNGYRMFSQLHLLQLKIARTAFKCEIVQGRIRDKAREIVIASGKEQFQSALTLAQNYLLHLQLEYGHALEAVELVEQWLNGSFVSSKQTYTRKEVAKLLHVSVDVVRNWERNGLLTVPRLENGHRAYTDNEVRQMKVIRTLRAAHYSYHAILRLFRKAEQETNVNIKEILDTPDQHEDIVTVTDRFIHSLQQAIKNAEEVIQLLESHLKNSH